MQNCQEHDNTSVLRCDEDVGEGGVVRGRRHVDPPSEARGRRAPNLELGSSTPDRHLPLTTSRQQDTRSTLLWAYQAAGTPPAITGRS
jgi:hypothetical protein